VTIVQIYEIQTPDEARAIVDLGVHHVGTVITSRQNWCDPVVRETVATVRSMGAVSSLIPLYTEAEVVFDTLDYHRPDVVHFCDALDGGGRRIDDAIQLQTAVRARFRHIRIMRAIPIGRRAADGGAKILELAVRMAPTTDFFLTDTVTDDASTAFDDDPGSERFVGITGLTCDWTVARQLVSRSRIPVILAGGISPENVAAGIRRVRPYGIDSCSCTNAVGETGRPIRFQKDLARVAALVAATRGADRERPRMK
jgi:phosphoribosylanthranilate isomerase